MQKKRVIILDTHAILHRAFHAIPDFETSKGEPTGALYGLASFVLRAVEELRPDYIIATRDLPGKTVRHEVYAEYKGTRQEVDPTLIEQLKKAPELLEAMAIPVLSAPGFEADDCIGTLVEKCSHKDFQLVIASGDMDTLQLVQDGVSVYTLRKGLNDTVEYDADAVRIRYGFGPEQVVDYKALRGDPSDNIKGIKGIGEKTATELIQHFGSLEGIYEAVKKGDEVLLAKGVKQRMIDLLKAGEADARFSKELATIRRDAPIDCTLPKKEWKLADNLEAFLAVCEKYEFRSLKDRAKQIASKQATKEQQEAQGALFAIEKKPDEQVDPIEFKEASIALWLLRSEYTNPGMEEIYAYANTDSFKTAQKKIFDDLKVTGRLQEVWETIEKPLRPVVDAMNAAGVSLDVEYLKKLATEYNGELAKLETKIHELAGHEFNINSPKQLGVVLFDELKISTAKMKKTASGARTTREDELVKLADQNPIIELVLKYRELGKLLGTYIEKMPTLVSKDGRLRTTFVQAGTTTGRISCEDPNLQNIPIKTELGRRIRAAFKAEKGNVLVAIDYSQIELRIAAGLSEDEKLVESFKNGEDIHTTVAAEVFGVPIEQVDKEMRRKAKVINFGILYGMGVNALKENLGAGTTRDDAQQYIDAYFTKFSGLATFTKNTVADATRKGYTETPFGRRRYFPALRSPLPQLRSQAERTAINAPMQGTQSDIIKLAMVEVAKLIEAKKWHNKAVLVMQIHDELVFEVKEEISVEAAKLFKKTMEDVAPIEKLSNVPIIAEASIGADWDNLTKI